MLSVAEEYLANLNNTSKLISFGQELNDQTFAICKADMLIKGNDAERIKSGNTLSDDQFSGETFDYIISNPPIRAGKKVVHQVIEEAYDYLNQGGNLTIVIQKKQGAPSAKAKMEDVFGNAEVVKKDKGYYILRSEKI